MIQRYEIHVAKFFLVLSAQTFETYKYITIVSHLFIYRYLAKRNWGEKSYTTMVEFKVLKLIVIMMLIMGVTSVDTNGVISEKIFSKDCAVYCSLKCTFFRGKARALCVVLCMLGCRRPPVVSKAVIDCISTCAQSTCSVYENSGNYI